MPPTSRALSPKIGISSSGHPLFIARLYCRQIPRESLTWLRLPHPQAAVDVEHGARDVACFFAGEKNDGCRDFRVAAHAAERYTREQSVFYIWRQRVGHWRNDEARCDGVHRDIARSDFQSQSARQTDKAGLGCNVIYLPRIPRLRY